jgi:hypothetical protein
MPRVSNAVVGIGLLLLTVGTVGTPSNGQPLPSSVDLMECSAFYHVTSQASNAIGRPDIGGWRANVAKRTMEWAFVIGKAEGAEPLGLNTQFQLALSRMTPFIHDSHNLSILIHQHQARCNELVKQVGRVIMEHPAKQEK